VPAGIYAKQALESAGAYDALKDRFVACPSVRAALRLVEDGQVEAGIVYNSDAVVSQRVVVVNTLPAQWYDPITFQMALLGEHQSAALSLADYLAGPKAQPIWAQFGFDRSAGQPGDAVVAQKDTGPFWRLGNEERSALLVSVKVALTSVALLIVPGIWLGFVLARKNFVGKSIVEGLVHIPLVLPPVVTGYLLLLVLGNNGFPGRWLHQTFGVELAFTFKAAAIASAVVALPLMVRSVRLAVIAADRGLEQASYMLGAGPRRTFFLISLPLAAPGVLAGLVLAFARSLGEFGATAVFMGNIEGQRTLPLSIYSSLQTAHGESFVWRLVAVSVILSIVALIASEALARRAARYLEPDDAS
jgi:molybdate transport system permease protein